MSRGHEAFHVQVETGTKEIKYIILEKPFAAEEFV
jgi:hypothetical protein